MDSKTCSNCNITKPLKQYDRRAASSDGLMTRCKSCVSGYKVEYRKTKRGLAIATYGRQRKKSKDRGHSPPGYTKEEFMDWMHNHPKFEQLYNDWAGDGFSKDLVPSVDRIDDEDHYHFDNIQLMTWRENNAKANASRLAGRITKQTRAVIKMTPELEPIEIYPSVSLAARENGVTRAGVIRGCRAKLNKHDEPAQYAGFVWRYVDDSTG